MENHNTQDRISNLTEDLINSILEYLPIQDAVRTSILSKNWRYKWTTIRALVFDEQFCTRFAENEAFSRNGFIRIINHIIFFQNGPISKFVLHIPDMFLDSFQEIDLWLLFLSRNGVQELTLVNSNRRYKLPSYFFSCLQLRMLSLENCFFKPPHDLQEFLYLKDLSLNKVDFGASSYGALFNLPQLKKLKLLSCTNVCNFNIKAKILNHMEVITCHSDAILLPSLQSNCLTTVVIASTKSTEEFPQVLRTNFTTMSRFLLNIVNFYVDNHFLKFFVADKTPMQLPPTVNRLKFLCLLRINLCDLDQLQGSFFLLRNSPKLIVLYVYLHPPMGRHSNVEPASNYLGTSDSLNQTLKHLLTIKLVDVEGSRPELLFIKLLLAHSPSLEKMTIRPSTAADAHTRQNIAQDVMQFPRASPKAEMLYLDPEHSSSKDA